MKKVNPLFYERTNANKGKISRAKRTLFLALALICTIGSVFALSIDHSTTKGKYIDAAGVSIALIAIGTVKQNEGETEEQFFKRYLEDVDKRIAKAESNPELKTLLEEFKAQAESIKKDKELLVNLKKEVGDANLAIIALKEKAEKKERIENIATHLKDWVETNKNALASIKAGTKEALTPLVIKTNSPMTPANTYNSSSFLPNVQIDPTPNEIVRVQPTLWSVLRKGRTKANPYVWVNKKNPLGAAGFIGPGVAKPGVSFELATESSNAKKIAVSDKCATELLDDIDGMASWIEQEMTYQLLKEMNSKLMSGTSSSTVPAGLQTISTTYTLSGVETANANNWDAIIALATQLRSGNLSGAVTAFVNPVDYANMILTKATSQGQLFVPAQTGVNIIEDNNIPVGYVQVAILDYYKVLILQDLTISYGWEDQDFTKNLVTAIAEMRIHQFFSENYTGFAIYDTFANVKSAITPAP